MAQRRLRALQWLELGVFVLALTVLLRYALLWAWESLILLWTGLFYAFRWVDERAASIAYHHAIRLTPTVWCFQWTVKQPFAERLVTSTGATYRTEVFEGDEKMLRDLKIEAYDEKVRVHRWLVSRGMVEYDWIDLTRRGLPQPLESLHSARSHLEDALEDALEHASVWSFEFTGFGDPVWYSWHMSLVDARTLSEATQCLRLVFWDEIIRWSPSGSESREFHVIFHVPLQEDTALEGRSHKEDWDWEWYLSREPR